MRGMTMRWMTMRWMLATTLIVVSGAAQAGWSGPRPGLTGNDTGGIIEWTPETDRIYRDIAITHCARWNRIANITSVHRWYGEYIGFQCIYDRRYDPRKAWLWGN
jgi:hypothetical protein